MVLTFANPSDPHLPFWYSSSASHRCKRAHQRPFHLHLRSGLEQQMLKNCAARLRERTTFGAETQVQKMRF